MHTVPCALCGRENTKPYLTVGEYTIVRCSCGFIYTNPQLTQAELDSLYSEDYTPYQQKVAAVTSPEESWAAAHSAWYYRVLRKIKRFFIPQRQEVPVAVDTATSKVVLDFGYGNGRYLLRTKREHPRWELYGYDIDPRPLEGVTTVASLDGLEGKFDLINVSHVLEHLPHPKETLVQLKALLKEGGEIVIEVPNIDCLKFRVFGKHFGALCLPHHLSHFSPTTMTELVTQAGLTVKEVQIFGSTKTTVRSIYNALHLQGPINRYVLLMAGYLTKLIGEKHINTDVFKVRVGR